MNIEEAVSLFEYKDGELFWKSDRGNQVKAGALAGSKSMYGYWEIRYKSKLYLRHRIIYLMFKNSWPDIIDHIDQNRTNDKIENLREVNKSQNNHNSIFIRGKITYRGVYYHKGIKKYVAQIRLFGKGRYLGAYSTPELASQRYEEEKKEYAKLLNIE